MATLFEFTYMQRVAQIMEPDDLAVAQELARMADSGDREAHAALRRQSWKAMLNHGKKEKSDAAKARI